MDFSFASTAGSVYRDDVGDFGSVASIVVQADGKILVGFNEIAHAARNLPRSAADSADPLQSGRHPDIDYVAKIDSTGALNTSFVPAPVTGGSVLDLALQEDGKVLIVGSFYSVGGRALRGFARLNADSSLDTAFADNILDDTNGTAYAVDILPDGRIVFGGQFTSWNNQNTGAYTDRVTNSLGFADSDPVNVEILPNEAALHTGALSGAGSAYLGSAINVAGSINQMNRQQAAAK